MLIFSDPHGKYRLADYNQSHSQLLIRKYKHKDIELNIDLIFKAVFSINISIVFHGIEIYVEKRSDKCTNSNPANRKFVIKIIDCAGLISFFSATSLAEDVAYYGKEESYVCVISIKGAIY